jgi:hypothetical protein
MGQVPMSERSFATLKMTWHRRYTQNVMAQNELLLKSANQGGYNMASFATTPQTGRYLHEITVAGDTVAVHPPGVAGACVEEIVERRLAALTSRPAVQKVRVQRSNLAAHHLVLSDLSNRQRAIRRA